MGADRAVVSERRAAFMDEQARFHERVNSEYARLDDEKVKTNELVRKGLAELADSRAAFATEMAASRAALQSERDTAKQEIYDKKVEPDASTVETLISQLQKIVKAVV